MLHRRLFSLGCFALALAGGVAGWAVYAAPLFNALNFTQPSGTIYEFIETFEGSTVDDQGNNGYDNSGWLSYQPTNAPTPHYTTSPAPLAGTYSFKAGAGDYDSISRTAGFTASANFNTYFQLNVAGTWNAGNFGHLVWIRGAGAVVVCALWLSSPSGRFNIGDTAGGNLANATGFSTATLYHVWLEYIKGTVPAGQAKFRIRLRAVATGAFVGDPVIAYNNDPEASPPDELTITSGNAAAPRPVARRAPAPTLKQGRR